MGALLALAACASLASAATTWTVGTVGKQFTRIDAAMKAAAAGDTIEVYPGTYYHLGGASDQNTVDNTDPCFTLINKDITIRGIGTRPVFDGWANSLKGQGMWVITSPAHNVTIENIEFQNCKALESNGGNAAAVYSDGSGATNITIRNCVIHDCQNGLRDGAGDTSITLEGVVLHDNGDNLDQASGGQRGTPTTSTSPPTPLR